MATTNIIMYRKTAAEIQNIPIVDGQLLFETDQGSNGKIFLDVGTNRLQIGGNFLPTYEAVFLSTGWSASAPYTQTVSVSGITSDYTSIPTLNQNNATSQSDLNNMQLNFSYITSYTSNDGSITATAKFTKPTRDLTVDFVGQ